MADFSNQGIRGPLFNPINQQHAAEVRVLMNMAKSIYKATEGELRWDDSLLKTMLTEDEVEVSAQGDESAIPFFDALLARTGAMLNKEHTLAVKGPTIFLTAPRNFPEPVLVEALIRRWNSFWLYAVDAKNIKVKSKPLLTTRGNSEGPDCWAETFAIDLGWRVEHRPPLEYSRDYIMSETSFVMALTHYPPDARPPDMAFARDMEVARAKNIFTSQLRIVHSQPTSN